MVGLTFASLPSSDTSTTVAALTTSSFRRVGRSAHWRWNARWCSTMLCSTRLFIGVPDETRGLAVKTYVVTQVEDPASLTMELQDHVKRELSPHEYPRTIEYVSALPKTPNGKVNRRALREGL